ncbi:MAG: hypothetical protein CMI32_06395 [Opitutales bacterium]|nr:hypothetical protein [Opitutales bacterium]
MAEFPIADLPEQFRKQIERASEMEVKNLDYAIDIYTNILKQKPGCLELRKRLREAQIKNSSGNTRISNFLGRVTAAPFRVTGKAKIEKDPINAMDEAEKSLASNPQNAIAGNLLAEAAIAAGFYGTAVFARETICKFDPENILNLRALGQAHLANEDTESAIRTGTLILKKQPGDAEAQELLKKASVAIALNKGKWEESDDYREKLKDQDEAQSIEQSNRSVTDVRGLKILIQQTYARIEAVPDDINNYREISDLYHRSNDVETAIAWIQKARELPNGKTDVALEQREHTLILEYFDNAVEQRQATLRPDPENTQFQAELQQAIDQRHTYCREQLASLIECYPNDYGYRYQYGEILFEERLYDEAIAQFQLAQRNPAVRLDTLVYLGRSYKEKGFHDLAIQQFAAAKSEIPVMDERKKESIYELAQCYEAKGQTEEAIEEYKEVYSADISFRDVAAKIDAYYSRNTAG